MQFLSLSFLILFLPLALLLYWKLIKSQRYRVWFLLAASLLFYSMGGIGFLPLLIGLSLTTYWLAQKNKSGWGIGLNLFALGVFKYLGFGTEQLQGLLDSLDLSFALPVLRLALPLGLSYYVFKHIGYLIDVQKGRSEPTNDILIFMTYSTFFPQISAGPISSFQDTGKQLSDLPTSFSSEMGYQGILHIMVGWQKRSCWLKT